MKISDVKAFYPKWRQVPTGVWQSHFWQIVVQIRSDAGVVGLGYGGGGTPGAAVVNEHLRELLVGREINSVEDIRETWDLLYFKSLPYGRKGISIMALSGIDLALWDLLGKERDEPVYKLLGGLTKSKVRAYATTSEFHKAVDLGYTAVKFSSQWRGEADYEGIAGQAARARALLGPDALVMSDCYMTWDAAVTLKMAEVLGEHDLYWFEDILTPDDLDEMAGLREKIGPVQLAGGEHEFTHHGFRDIARTRALDIWQPDITWCGGITAGLRILDLAREAGASVVPHRGGEIWGLHLIAATDCADLAETMPARWSNGADVLWNEEPQAKDGYIRPSDRPGFGVTLDDSLL